MKNTTNDGLPLIIFKCKNKKNLILCQNNEMNKKFCEFWFNIIADMSSNMSHYTVRKKVCQLLLSENFAQFFTVNCNYYYHCILSCFPNFQKDIL